MITTESRATTEAAAQWVQQGKRLWTGRVDGKPIGTIERGRRFTYLDVHGVPTSGFRTLSEAQLAHLPAPTTATAEEPVTGLSRTERVLMAATTVAAFGTVSLLVAALPVLR